MLRNRRMYGAGVHVNLSRVVMNNRHEGQQACNQRERDVTNYDQDRPLVLFSSRFYTHYDLGVVIDTAIGRVCDVCHRDQQY
jgi:hypothetical protein